ncbi:MAG TPA: M28 family peptidase [Gemmatimonadaceae bacterium]|nr:M28 family peptidase [Gemmatimonadaceae bacterium]
MSIRRVVPLLRAVFLAVCAACSGEQPSASAGPGADSLALRASAGFDAPASMRYLKTALGFGTRVPGSPGHKATGDWIVTELRARGATVTEQVWTHTTKSGATLPMRNIVARWNPSATQRVLYMTHWDTRPKAEKAPAADTLKPVIGANDGTSGIALFLAIADALKAKPTTVGVDLVLVDGEDYGEFGPPEVDVFIGSQYFAAHLPTPGYKPAFAVVWDMIGDRSLQIFQETISLEQAPEVVARVWRRAEALGYGNFFIQQPKYAVRDDHVSLQAVGIKAIDVIDIDYPYHHTLEDTEDKVSVESMQVVGNVAMSLIRELEAPTP